MVFVCGFVFYMSQESLYIYICISDRPGYPRVPVSVPYWGGDDTAGARVSDWTALSL